MRGDQVTDKNLCMAMLNHLKWDAVCLTNKILECSDQSLRQDYINVLDRTFAEQKSLYDLANQHGWHQPMMANQNLVSQVQSDVQKLSSEQQQSMSTIHQQAQYQGIQNQQAGYQNQQSYSPVFYNQQQQSGGSFQQNY
ncbi:spore coat protein [Desulforamulus ruminis]|uniref:Coat F domain protein n=1 Tax=Desulforamulus ruminis (strain ATCC 23193 / DSM 2154 / NCIMB 8452 / DL) TaxID=696281 RepID=F6DUP5_DESRL|nr:spore coat protein [Desulforamulus ruminis]AEG60183.1 Coat F domain protein [Desulforamulus ruminis DSM 2154]